MVRLQRNLNFFDRFSKKTPSIIKFHENPSSGSRIVPRVWKDGRADGLIDMTKLIVTFLNFAKALKNSNMDHRLTTAFTTRSRIREKKMVVG
jgi:hypothetical protein